MNVGQAVDREVVLNDIELLTGQRPAATRYDERKWSIVLPRQLTQAIIALPGVRVGRRITRPRRCQRSCWRSLPGGRRARVPGRPLRRGWAGARHCTRWAKGEDDAMLEHPAYSQSAMPEHVDALKAMMAASDSPAGALRRETEGAKIYEYPDAPLSFHLSCGAGWLARTRCALSCRTASRSSSASAIRYCVDKAMRASAAAVYWRTVERINQQRLWMSDSARRNCMRRAAELSFTRRDGWPRRN